jgi:uncharacterized membrane protein YsdA (DUF1294 family)
VLLFATDLRSGQQHFFVLALAVWLLLVNVLTLAIYGVDKMAARRTWRRVPEATLLTFGLLGGWAGAIVGQQLFRHKTQSSRSGPGLSSARSSASQGWWRFMCSVLWPFIKFRRD